MNNLLKGLNVYLIGMMGVGKSTIGSLLAQKLNYRFFDTDTLIEKVTNQTINQIFITGGELTFRDLETQVLRELSVYNKSVIATGGGIILKPENWSCLHYGLIIWLDAPVELLVKRLNYDEQRPLLQDTDLTTKLNTLLNERLSLYSEADIQISIEEHQTPEDIVDLIVQNIPSVLKNSVLS